MLASFVGSAGNAILFAVSGLAVITISLYVVGHAAHAFLVAFQETAAGNDEGGWTNAPFLDWLHEMFLILWIAAVWLVPLGLFIRAAKPPLLAEHPEVGFLIAGVMLWLLFPVGVLSAMSHGSWWVFFSPKLVGGLFRVLPAVATFYVVSVPCWALMIMPWFFAFDQGWKALTLLAPGAGGAGLLLYGRLLGWLAWQLSCLPARRKGKKSPAGPRPKVRAAVADPWAAPAQEELPREPEPE